MPLRSRSWAAIVLTGFVLWFPFELMLMLNQLDEAPLQAFLLSAVGALMLAGVTLRYYLLFMPLALGGPLDRRTFDQARAYARTRRLLAVRVLIPPFVVMLLLWAVIRLPSPDGRLLGADWALLLTAKVFWVLASFLTVAAALLYMPDEQWRAGKLDPYRDARLATLRAKAAPIIARMFSPRYALRLFLLSLVLQIVNLVRLDLQPPAAEIRVSRIEIDGSRLRLTMSLSDPRYHFRGFNPYYLRLAGPEPLDIVAPMPERVTRGENGATGSSPSLAGESAAVLTVQFKTSRDTSGLKDLRDLHLWYLGTRLTLLEMKTATVKAADG